MPAHEAGEDLRPRRVLRALHAGGPGRGQEGARQPRRRASEDRVSASVSRLTLRAPSLWSKWREMAHVVGNKKGEGTCRAGRLPDTPPVLWPPRSRSPCKAHGGEDASNRRLEARPSPAAF